MEDFQVTGKNPTQIHTANTEMLWTLESALITRYSQSFFPLFLDANMQNETAFSMKSWW